MSIRTVIILFVSCVVVNFGRAQETYHWQFDAGFTYSHFQQQVKADVGDPRGERLSYELQVGFLAMGTYHVWEYFSAGVFVQFDRGNRHTARFAGFDSVTGRTVTDNSFGGNFNEFWIGPFVRAQWKNFFGEAGWAVIGIRDDGSRTDLPSESGDTTGTFDLLPRVAFFAGLGAAVPFDDRLSLVFRFEFRLRYFKGREGKAFLNNFEHGMQNITPFVGVSWKL